MQICVKKSKIQKISQSLTEENQEVKETIGLIFKEYLENLKTQIK